MSDGRVVIVTGAAQGIGYGIASRFARSNDRVVVADMNLEKAELAAKALSELGASDACGIFCDVSQRQSVEQMIKQTVVHFGRIDVLVNNAGICPFESIMDMSPQVWQKTFDVNCTGAFHCTQLVAKQMIEQADGGRIVFITSLSTEVTGPSQVDYAASKSAMRMTMVGFATALGQYGITCNAVVPGMILTDLTRCHWEKPGPAEAIKKRVPMGRIGTPDDIGYAVHFLASEQAQYISGTSLRVDGGHQAVCH